MNRWLEARYARPASRFVTVDDARLHVLDEGPPDAVAVVALSAQWANFSMWDGWAPALFDRYRVLRIDLPGQGLSGPIPSGDYSIDAYERLMLGVLDQLKVGRFFLVGTSFSGVVAFRYAAHAGERLLGLVLANASGLPRPAGGPSPNAPPPSLWLRILAEPWRPRAYFRWKLEEMLRDRRRVTPARVREYTHFNNSRRRIAEAQARVRSYRSGDPLPTLAAITAPVLIQWSTHSAYLPVADAGRFEAALTGAAVRKIIYPDVGHLIIEDAPEATGRDVRAFVDAVLAGRWPHGE